MKSQIILAHGMLPMHAGWGFGIVALLLLVLFVALVVNEGAKGKDKQ